VLNFCRSVYLHINVNFIDKKVRGISAFATIYFV